MLLFSHMHMQIGSLFLHVINAIISIYLKVSYAC